MGLFEIALICLCIPKAVAFDCVIGEGPTRHGGHHARVWLALRIVEKLGIVHRAQSVLVGNTGYDQKPRMLVISGEMSIVIDAVR